MTISQVQLANTFNEFRSTFNTAANTLNSFQDASGIITANVIAGVTLSASELTVSTLSANKIVVTNSGGVLSTDSGLDFTTSSNTLSVNGPVTVNSLTSNGAISGTNATATGNLAVTGTSTLTGTTTFGSGANNATFFSSNGYFEISKGVKATVDLHADQHIGAGGELSVWVAAKGDDQTTHKVFGIANTDAATDMLIVNTNIGANAYAEFIAIHHSGNTDQGWVSMGVNSENYDQGAFSITKADDAYMLYSAPVGTTESGDLVIGTSGNGTGNKIIFSADGFDDPANNTQMVITPGQNIHIEIDTESANTTTGALTVNGGIGLVGNLNIGGNVAITGTITLGGGGNTVSTSSLSVDNPMVFLGANNAADTFDLGFVGEYTSSGTKYTGLVRDANDNGIYKLFNGISTEPSNTVNFTSASYSTLQVGGLKAVDTTASSSTTTGALIVSGGAGVAGAVNAGGAIKTTDTTASSSTTTGALIAGGGLGVAGAAYIGGRLESQSTTKIQQVLEKITVSATAATGTINFDALTQGVMLYTTDASANWTLNIRGDSGTTLDSLMAVGESLTIAFIVKQGATARYASAHQIDGASVTPKWQGGSAPSSGNANSLDSYTYSVVKTGAATFTVFASVTPFA